MATDDIVLIKGNPRNSSRRYFIRALLATFLCVTLFAYFLWNVYAIRANKSLLKSLLDSSQNIRNDFLKLKNKKSLQPSKSQEVVKRRTSPPKSAVFNFDDVLCYKRTDHNVKNLKFLKDFTDSPKQPTNGRAIFFAETSCMADFKHNIITLQPRRACAIESAAIANPGRDIFVMFMSRVGFPKNESDLPPLVKNLQSYSNVHFRHAYMPKLVKNTPVENWFFSGTFFKTTSYLQPAVSDFLRFILLYKYGGTYIDLDVISLKNLDGLTPNYLAREDDKVMGSAIINFSHEGIGHEMASIILQEFASRFNGSDWMANGPELLRRVAERLCGTDNYRLQTRKRCVALEVHPPKIFFPFQHTEWWKMFASNQTSYMLRKFKHSFGIHTWNTHRNMIQIDNEPKSAFSILGKKYCPKSAAVASKNF